MHVVQARDKWQTPSDMVVTCGFDKMWEIPRLADEILRFSSRSLLLAVS